MLSVAQAATAAVTDSTPFFLLEVIGTVAFAVSGVMAAARARMDWLGAMVLALVVAIGGGTLRDVLLGQLPVVWLKQSWPVAVALGTAIVVLLMLRAWPRTRLDATMPILIADAAGLSAFVILGTQVGLKAGLNPPMAVLIGVLSGIGGGILRDLLTGNKPVVLVGQIYAVAGLVGASCLVAMDELGINPEFSVWICVALVFIIRWFAIRRDWNLPSALPVAEHDEPDSSTRQGGSAVTDS